MPVSLTVLTNAAGFDLLLHNSRATMQGCTRQRETVLQHMSPWRIGSKPDALCLSCHNILLQATERP